MRGADGLQHLGQAEAIRHELQFDLFHPAEALRVRLFELGACPLSRQEGARYGMAGGTGAVVADPSRSRCEGSPRHVLGFGGGHGHRDVLPPVSRFQAEPARYLQPKGVRQGMVDSVGRHIQVGMQADHGDSTRGKL